MLIKSLRKAFSVLNSRPIIWPFFVAAEVLNKIALSFGGNSVDVDSGLGWVFLYSLFSVSSVIVFGGALYALHEVLFDETLPAKTVLKRFSESALHYSGKLIVFAIIAGAGLAVAGILDIFGYGLGLVVQVLFQPLFFIWPLLILSRQRVLGAMPPAFGLSCKLFLPLLALALTTYIITSALQIGADALYALVNRLGPDDIPGLHYVGALFCFPLGLWTCLRSGAIILLADSAEQLPQT